MPPTLHRDEEDEHLSRSDTLHFSFEQSAEREGVTKAEMIRRALRAAVERDGGQSRPSIFGVFDGPEDLSERTDERLDDGFGGGVIVLDTSVVLALLNARDRNHDRAREWVISNEQALATTPLAVAEMDYLVRGVTREARAPRPCGRSSRPARTASPLVAGSGTRLAGDPPGAGGARSTSG